MRHALLAVLALCFEAAAARADDYTIFNPVPDDKQRPMGSQVERPTKADSPVTVDAGHVLVETSLLNVTHDKDCKGGTCFKTDEWDIGATTNIRIGLTQSSELQIILSPYENLSVKDETAGLTRTMEGFGDTVLRFKHNFWGNDGGATAFAIMPFIKLSTNQHGLGNNDVEGGIEIPFNINFSDTLSLNPITQLGWQKDPSRSGYYWSYINAAALTKTFSDAWSGYVEIFTDKPDGSDARWQNTLDLGIIYTINDHFSLDTGVNLGITQAADDVNWFVGMSYRF